MLDLVGQSAEAGILDALGTEGVRMSVELEMASERTTIGLKDHAIRKGVTGPMQAAHINVGGCGMPTDLSSTTCNSVVAGGTIGV